MKTFFICATSNIEYHVGEEYDSILEVDSEIISEHGDDNYGSQLIPITEWHNRIRNRIRKLWHDDATPEGATREEGDEQEVHVWLDAASPFNAMLIDLQIVMEKEEGIVIKLPYLPEGGAVRTTNDPEALELIEKLDNR
jgi:hypothetical protein